MPRTYDVVLFGATGFTGKLVAEYLARKHASALRWTIAGRSEAKLADVKAEIVRIEPALSALDVLVADSADTALRLARFFRTTPQFWMNMQASYELRKAANQTGRALRRIAPVAKKVA